jgi:hypothetical protein
MKGGSSLPSAFLRGEVGASQGRGDLLAVTRRSFETDERGAQLVVVLIREEEEEQSQRDGDHYGCEDADAVGGLSFEEFYCDVFCDYALDFELYALAEGERLEAACVGDGLEDLRDVLGVGDEIECVHGVWGVWWGVLGGVCWRVLLTRMQSVCLQSSLQLSEATLATRMQVCVTRYPEQSKSETREQTEG